MPLWNDAHIKRMMFIGFSRKNELPMARLYSFHAFPLKFQRGKGLCLRGTSALFFASLFQSGHFPYLNFNPQNSCVLKSEFGVTL